MDGILQRHTRMDGRTEKLTWHNRTLRISRGKNDKNL